MFNTHMIMEAVFFLIVDYLKSVYMINRMFVVLMGNFIHARATQATIVLVHTQTRYYHVKPIDVKTLNI